MKLCPICDEIYIIRTETLLGEKGWHVSCDCGNAWYWGSFCRTKREAKKNWERLVKAWELNQQKTPSLQED